MAATPIKSSKRASLSFKTVSGNPDGNWTIPKIKSTASITEIYTAATAFGGLLAKITGGIFLHEDTVFTDE